MSISEQIKGSLAAIIFGFIFIIGSICVTWWNEGRTIKTHKGLEEGAKSVYTSTTINYVSPENDGKLIHLSGGVTTSDMLEDTDFGLKIPHIKLKRTVEIYQWKENKDTKQKENSEEKTTEYSYEKVWEERVRNSQNFNEASSHQNAVNKKYESFSKTASNVFLGAHGLNQKQVNKLNNWAGLKFTEISSTEDVQISNSEGKPTELYIGNTSLSNPEIGDLRISYQTVYEGDYSIIAKQSGSSFESYTTERGTTIDLVKSGIHSADSMFTAEISHNSFIKWLFRAGGFLFIFIGIRMLFSLITMFTNKVPILRSIVNFGISLFAGILAFCLFFIVAGIAWVFYRPVIGISLLVIGIGTLVLSLRKEKN